MNRRSIGRTLGATGVVALSACAGGAQPSAGNPENATVLYMADVGGNTDIFLRAPGKAPTRLTTHPAQDHWPGWSPSAGLIVFQTLRDGNREVYTMDATGEEAVNLTRDPADDLLPEWSPDGRHVLFFSTRGEPRGPEGEYMGNLWIMAADGSSPRRLTSEPLTSSFGGSWTPAGDRVLFTRDVGTLAIHELDLGTGLERRLTTDPESYMGARVSPDGSRLVASRSVGEESRIVVLDRDGTHPRDITSGGLDYYPHWSPDGRWIVYTATAADGVSHDIHVVSAEGGEPRPLVATSDDERSGRWIVSPPNLP